MSNIISFSSRCVDNSYTSQETAEGKGAIVWRSINSARFLDPFIMLDEFSVQRPAGFQDHAHRGLETVTFVFPDSKGSMCHEDFLGNKGTLNPGDVQVMSSGKGIMHAEMPLNEVPCTGLQLWVNMPGKDKMGKPKYIDYSSKDLRKINENGCKATLLSGSCFLGISSEIVAENASKSQPEIATSTLKTSPKYWVRYPTKLPTHLVWYELEPYAILDHALPDDWNAFVYVVSGSGWIGPNAASRVPSHGLDASGTVSRKNQKSSQSVQDEEFGETHSRPQNKLLQSDGAEPVKARTCHFLSKTVSLCGSLSQRRLLKEEKDLSHVDQPSVSSSSHIPPFVSTGVRLCASSSGMKILLAAGKPVDEPMVQKGPFVMNTEAQIDKAFRDWQTKSNGFEHLNGWKSDIGQSSRKPNPKSQKSLKGKTKNKRRQTDSDSD